MNQDQWKLSVVFKWIHKPSNRFIANTFIYFNLSNWCPCNKLAFNLKKGKSVILFSTGNRLNLFQDCQVKLSVSECFSQSMLLHDLLWVSRRASRLDTSFWNAFSKNFKKAAGGVNLLRHIRSSIDAFSTQQIYQSMITVCQH